VPASAVPASAVPVRATPVVPGIAMEGDPLLAQSAPEWAGDAGREALLCNTLGVPVVSAAALVVSAAPVNAVPASAVPAVPGVAMEGEPLAQSEWAGSAGRGTLLCGTLGVPVVSAGGQHSPLCACASQVVLIGPLTLAGCSIRDSVPQLRLAPCPPRHRSLSWLRRLRCGRCTAATCTPRAHTSSPSPRPHPHLPLCPTRHRSSKWWRHMLTHPPPNFDPYLTLLLAPLATAAPCG